MEIAPAALTRVPIQKQPAYYYVQPVASSGFLSHNSYSILLPLLISSTRSDSDDVSAAKSLLSPLNEMSPLLFQLNPFLYSCLPI